MQETPKERAVSFIEVYDSKEKAIAHCDSLIGLFELLHKPEYATFDIKDPSGDWYNGYSLSEYYEEVKKEIDLL